MLDSAAGFARASTDEDMEPVYKENLMEDFKSHAGVTCNLEGLLDMLKVATTGKRNPRHLSLLIVQKGTIQVVSIGLKLGKLSAGRTQSLVQGLVNGTHHATHPIVYPDTVMFLNTWDEPYCRGRIMCTVPVFSLIKRWNFERSKSLASDVLFPFFNHYYGDLIEYPWDLKVNKVLMRAAMQNGMSLNCTRMKILEHAKDPKYKDWLDVGITNNLKVGLQLPLADYVSIPDHAKWRFLFSADGYTASCRFGKLLQTNSVVLKEASQWIEFYYRSVKPMEHYVEFTKKNVMQVVGNVMSMTQSQLKEIADNGQKFAYKYLSQHSKALYMRKAMETLNLVCPDFPKFASSLKLSANTNIDDILSALEAAVTRQASGGQI